MAQPGIPAARGAAAGLQGQNGAASASGSPYTNGECRMGAGRTARPGPGRPPSWVCRGEWQVTAGPREPRQTCTCSPALGVQFHMYLYIRPANSKHLRSAASERNKGCKRIADEISSSELPYRGGHSV